MTDTLYLRQARQGDLYTHLFASRESDSEPSLCGLDGRRFFSFKGEATPTQSRERLAAGYGGSDLCGRCRRSATRKAR